MKKLMACLTLLLGIILAIFAGVLNYRDTPAFWQDLAVGVLVAGASLSVVLLRSKPVPRWPFLANLVLGAWLIASGIFVFGRYANANRIVDIASGIVICALSVLATQVVEGKKGYVYTKDGGVLLELSRVGYKDGAIEAKGKAYGSMPQTMRIPPDQVWILLGLFPFELILRLPQVLIAGCIESRRSGSGKPSTADAPKR